MISERTWFDEVAFPALLRAARATYGAAIRAALVADGFDDVPRNGIYVIGALARAGAPLSQIIKDLGVSKQSAGALIDALVLRGYLERAVDPEDRRRLTVSLTERGRAAAALSRREVDRIDTELLARVGLDVARHARATLWALTEIGRASGGDPAGDGA
jgi:DNA-binding MarR family transcriptional regulator